VGSPLGGRGWGGLCLLPLASCLLLPSCLLPLALLFPIPYSLFTIHYSLFTIPFFCPIQTNFCYILIETEKQLADRRDHLAQDSHQVSHGPPEAVFAETPLYGGIEPHRMQCS